VFCCHRSGAHPRVEYGSPWKKIWHLPVTFACVQHQRFLRQGCPQGHAGIPEAWALIAYPSASDLHPLQCRMPTQAGKTGRHRASCGVRLDRSGQDGLPRPAQEALSLQERLLALLSPQHPAGDAARTFADLRLIATLLCMSWPALAPMARTRGHNPRQTVAAILARHQSACSPALLEAALPLATGPQRVYKPLG
jgi:hypothetical protein